MTVQQLNPSSRDEILMEFALDTSGEPVRARLARFVAMYPEHASALARLALELEDFDQATQEDLCEESIAEQNAAIDEAIAALDGPAAAHADPFAAASPPQLQGLATALDANLLFVARLKDRMIDVGTMTEGFLAAVAAFFSVPLEAVRAALSAPPRLAAGMKFKAEGKPGTAEKESFEEALNACALTDAQKDRLRNL